MTSSVKTILLASSVAALALTTGALARDHRYDDRDRAIRFSLETGGYCDNSGCPDRFWRYPVHYGPVFVEGRWFLGPVYFRGDRYGREYWVRGAWHRDEWRGRRPGWARESHDGPALSFSYYADHGFRLEGHWRHQFDRDNGRDRGGDRDGRDDHGDNWRPDHGDDNRGDHAGHDDGPPNDGRGDWHRSDNGGDPRDGHNGDNGAMGGHNGRDQGDNVVRVTSATYGGATCHQPNGNVTSFLATACNGKKICDYSVQYQNIGDPAPGCAKDFAVQWTCSMGPGGSAGAPAEAGLGSHVILQCANPGH